MKKFPIFFAVGLCVSTALADELVVPTQFPTIQKAVDAAKPGDVVLVKGGTYAGIVFYFILHCSILMMLFEQYFLVFGSQLMCLVLCPMSNGNQIQGLHRLYHLL